MKNPQKYAVTRYKKMRIRRNQNENEEQKTCGQKTYNIENKEICKQEIISCENYKQQQESERVKNESEEQRIVGLADMRKRVSESVKKDSEEQRNVLLKKNNIIAIFDAYKLQH